MNTKNNLDSFLILSVEDDSDYYHLLNTLLVQQIKSGAVSRVEDGEEFLQFLQNCADDPIGSNHKWPDLILMDINMPRKNGIEALKEMRSDPRFPPIPVLMFTISDDLEDIKKSYEAGANGFITKPTNLQELIGVLQHAVNYWKNLEEKQELTV